MQNDLSLKSFAKKLIFNVLLGVQTFHVLKTVQKCKKSLKTLNFEKLWSFLNSSPSN